MVLYIQIKGNNLSRKKLSKGNSLIDQNNKTAGTTNNKKQKQLPFKIIQMKIRKNRKEKDDEPQ